MRIRRGIAAFLPVLVGVCLASSCGRDTSLAGKTTTTSNGGDLVAMDDRGAPLARCVALVARGWDPARGVPLSVDTIQGGADGRVHLPEGAILVEVRDDQGLRGGRLVASGGLDGIRRVLVLDTLRTLEGIWPERAGDGRERLYLDSSFQSAVVDPRDGAFRMRGVPAGTFRLKLDPGAGPARSMGDLRVDGRETSFRGTANIVVAGDTTGSPLWVDDFEAASPWSLLSAGVPGASRWYMWWMGVVMELPVSVEPDSIARAFVTESVRGGRVFQTRFSTVDDISWVALGLTDLQLDLRQRREVCFAYRSDSPLRLEFQRDSISGVRPTMVSTLPSSATWRDTCAATGDLKALEDTPDSLAVWGAFARRVLVIQFSVLGGGTFLELDDIRLR